MNRKVTVWVAIILLVCFFGAFVFSFLSSFAVSAETLQDKINKATSEKIKIQGELNKVKEQQQSVLTEKNEIEKKIDKTQDEIDKIQSDINACQDDINIKTAELEVATKEAEKQYDTMKTRLRAMYEDNSTSYITLLFSGENLSDIVSYVEIVKQIVSYDDTIHDKLIDTQNSIDDAKAELVDKKTQIEVKKSEQVTKKNELAKGKAELDSTSTKLANDIETIKKAEAQAEAAEKSLKAQFAASQQSANNSTASGGVVYGGGQFLWPTPGYTTITCPYGPRIHPVLKVSKRHTGVDIGAPAGATVVAAADGVVTSAGYNSAYGNYVIINHGSGLSTLYGHHTKNLVSSGQTVKRGQAIGKVGSTGYSTGPHCHFEVLKNGQDVDPMPYLK